MSRSSYRETTTEDRDYESRRDRERERARGADRYDEGESRHHGKWTASSETADLEGSGVTAPRRSLSRKESRESHHDRDYDREDRRSRSAYDNDSYGSIPTPPPAPPADFYQPRGSWRQSHPASSGYGGYGSHPSSYGGYGHSTGYGAGYHPSSYGGYGHSGYGSSGYGQHYGSGYGDDDTYAMNHPSVTRGVHPIHQAFLAQQGHRSTGYGSSGYGHSGYGTGYGHSGYGTGYGHSGYGTGYGHSGYGTGYGHSGYGQHYGSGYGQHYGSGYGQHYGSRSLSSGTGLASEFTGHQSYGQSHPFITQGYHMTRPHADIYELGNDYIIELDLPGHSREHVDIKLSGNELYIISKPPKRDQNWHINERWLGRHNVERKFYLPADVNGGAIAPVLSNGVLKLVLPRQATAATSVTAAAVPHGRTTTTNDTTTTTTTTTQAAVL